MKNVFADKICVGAALVGMGLMIATLATGANPVEGSVITPFLRETLVGNVILIMLIATSFPTMLTGNCTVGALWKLGLSIPLPLQYPCWVLLQGLVYFCLAKLVLFLRRIIRG